MEIYINNKCQQLPADSYTVASLLLYLGIPSNGTAVAVNNRLVSHCSWENRAISEGDRLTVISAAYGG